MEKKLWEQPTLEVLDVNMTMQGPGKKIQDAFQEDPDELVNHS